MKKKAFPLSKVYGLLEPGPVVLVTTAHRDQANVMTMSWHTMMDFEPPLIGYVMSNRNHSFKLLKASRECVINIPSVEISDKVVACGNASGKRINKFETFHLTPKPAASVKAPLIDECFVNLECRVIDTRMVNQYCFFVVEVVSAWASSPIASYRTIHHLGMGHFMVAGETIKIKSRKK